MRVWGKSIVGSSKSIEVGEGEWEVDSEREGWRSRGDKTDRWEGGEHDVTTDDWEDETGCKTGRVSI